MHYRPEQGEADACARAASYVDSAESDAHFVATLTELVADHSDQVLDDYLSGGVSYPRLRDELAALTRRAAIHPIFFGSAITGAGVLETGFDRYQAVTGPPPTRARTDHNPLDRKEYLLHVQHRV